MEYKYIKYEAGKVARIILNRPRYRNALSTVLLEEMDDAFGQAMADEEIRVVVLSAEGDHFSSGDDLGTPDELADQQERGRPTDGEGRYKRSREIYLERALHWRNLEKPTIAMVQGYCIYGAWMFASAMDVIFASEDALFLPAHTECFSAPWDIGPRKAKEVLFEHRFMTAYEACEQHFVNRVYSRDRLEEETLAYANRVAENDPFRLRLLKFSINHMVDTMGYRAEAENAFHTYSIQSQLAWNTGKRNRDQRQIAQASVALKNLQLSLKYQRTKGQLPDFVISGPDSSS